jgi:outer membrane protein insertion porin family
VRRLTGPLASACAVLWAMLAATGVSPAGTIDPVAAGPALQEPPDPGPAGPPPPAGAPLPTEATPDEESTGRSGGRAIGKIFVDGNVRVSDSAFFNSLRIKPGDPFDERAIHEEYRRLWDLGLFDDIIVESRQRAPGVFDLIFHVQDRPLINGVAFVGMKAVTEANILEALGKVKAEVRRGQPVDFSTLRRAEGAIEQLLAEKGYLEARVRARLTPVSQGQREVTFHIREGAKTKIKAIDFVGNKVFSDRRLRKMLKLTRQARWLTSWASSKVLYHPAKFDQDAESIRSAYKSLGHLDIHIKPEIVELAKKGRAGRHAAGETGQGETGEEEDDFWEPTPDPAPPPGQTEKERAKRVKAELKARREGEKTPKKWVRLTVPIEEGLQYRVGTIDVQGHTVFSTQEIIGRLPLRSGMVFNDSALKFAAKRIEEDYGERGYFYVSLNPRIEKRERVADIRLEITEDRKYFVDRIEFTGNTNTRDGVLRREVPLFEEDLFNVRRLRLGMRKIAQLGYWQVGDDPVVKPLEGSERVDIEVQGVEANRNEIQVGGGVSGLEGGFFQASYATRNFLGRGEILSTFVQTGARANRYSLNFTEPWFLGKPWTLGFSLFRRDTDFVGFKRHGSGGTIVLGRLLGHFSRVDVAYGYEQVDFQPTRAGLGSRTSSATSSLTSIYSIDTRNNFFRPTRGFRVQTSLEYAGGVLGGDNWFVKPRLDATLYLPGLARRHYLGLNASYSYVTGFGGRVVPFFERFYLGGERSLRVFRTREVSPARQDIDVNQNGFIDAPEDRIPNGVFDPCEDLNGNGRQDGNEVDRGNCLLDPSEDLNGNGLLDTEDLNRNGVLDPGEDANGNGLLDTEDANTNGQLDPTEDLPDGFWTPFCPVDDTNMNGTRDTGEIDNGNCRLDFGEDTNADGAFGTVFPGGNKFLLFNAEYAMPLSDAAEFVVFYDAGNAFDDGERVTLDGMRSDYGVEMRFYLPVFQAPLRLIYGFIQNPRRGEDSSSFLFSIGTTF